MTILNSTTAAATLLARIVSNITSMKVVGEVADQCQEAYEDLVNEGRPKAAAHALKARKEFDVLFQTLMDTTRADMATYDSLQSPSTITTEKE